MPVTKERFPESYERDAPKFDDEKPDEILRWFEQMERILEIAKVDPGDKNDFILRYVVRRVKNQWVNLASYKLSYAEFKKEILDNYPSARDDDVGSVRKLKKDISKFDDGDLTIDDADDVLKLIRVIQVEVVKLRKSGSITDRETVPLFMSKLDKDFRRRIEANLDTSREVSRALASSGVAQAAAAAAIAAGGQAPQVPQTSARKQYTFDEVCAEAKRLVTDQDEKDEFWSGEKLVRPSSRGRDMSLERKPKSESHKEELMLEVKGAVAQMMDQLETQHKQAVIETSSREKKLEELLAIGRRQQKEHEQFYKSLNTGTGSGPSHTDARLQDSGPPREVRFRPQSSNDMCRYCREGDHWQNECPHRHQHILNGWLKVIDGRDCYSDGGFLPMGGPRSRKDLIEESARRKGLRPAGQAVAYQSTYLQEAPGLYRYNGESATPAYDYSEQEGYVWDAGEYDPRDEMILTMKVEMESLRDRERHAAAQRAARPPPVHSAPVPVSAPVAQQTPPMMANMVDVGTLAALLNAARLTAQPGQATTESQNVQTRAGSSRTGAAQGNEDFR